MTSAPERRPRDSAPSIDEFRGGEGCRIRRGPHKPLTPFGVESRLRPDRPELTVTGSSVD